MVQAQEICENRLLKLQEFINDSFQRMQAFNFKSFEQDLTEYLHHLHDDISASI